MDKARLTRAAAIAIAAGVLGFPQSQNEAVIISGDFVVEGQVVKGVPYSAQAVTSIKQTLATGAEITTEMKTPVVARDAEGRTRREQAIGPLGPWAMVQNPGWNEKREPSPTLIVIQDPVKQMNYILDPRTHLARYSHQEPFDPALYAERLAAQRERANRNEPRTERIEPLGNKIIEGVQTKGKRTVTTFPVGSVGNSAPLNLVVETWYSPDLKVVVLGKRSDPRVGDITYRLVNIKRGDPPASLFEVPSDYRLETERRNNEEQKRKEEN